MSADLNAEMLAASMKVRNPHLDFIRKLGVTSTALAEVGHVHPSFGIANVETDRGPFAQPIDAPAGCNYVVQPVIENGDTVDLVYWRSLQPLAWKWRNGCGWALGSDAITEPSLYDGFALIVIHCSPLAWLASGGVGACILDWDAEPQIRQLSIFAHIEVDDHEVARRLRSILARPVRVPRINVGQEARRFA